jgi:SET domain-containing protein
MRDQSPPALRVAKSLIQGKGLFTGEPIRARRKLGEFTGERISTREAAKRARGAKRIVIVDVTEKEAIDGSVRGGPFQYINHSCTANVFIRIAYGRIEFYARRDIRAGEELTCDYGLSYHEGELACRCGSTECKKFI